MIILILLFGRLKILRRMYSRSRYPYACRSIVLPLLLKPSMEALVMFPKRQNPRIPSQWGERRSKNRIGAGERLVRDVIAVDDDGCACRTARTS